MEDVMAEVQKRCTGYGIWYKLYADDLVVTLSHQNLATFIDTLF